MGPWTKVKNCQRCTILSQQETKEEARVVAVGNAAKSDRTARDPIGGNAMTTTEGAGTTVVTIVIGETNVDAIDEMMIVVGIAIGTRTGTSRSRETSRIVS